MGKNKDPFGSIPTKKKKTAEQQEKEDAFVNGAKVDGDSNPKPKPKPKKVRSRKKAVNENRRGSSYKNDEGEIVRLAGKVIQIPVNATELALLEKGAEKAGLNLAAFLRNLGLAKSRRS